MKKIAKKFPIISLGFMLLLGSCEQEKLADVGQLPDLTPPVSDFSFSNTSLIDLSEEEAANAFRFFDLAQNSISSTDFQWVIPNNVVLKDLDNEDGKEPSLKDEKIRVEFPEEGTFEVSLEASDKLLQSSFITKEIAVIEPAPLAVLPAVIQNAGFDGNRNVWFKESFGRKYSGTGDFFKGTPEAVANKQAAKLNSGMAIYQVVEVTKNIDYVITYQYSLKTSDTNPGEATVTVIAGEVNTPAELKVITDAGQELGQNIGAIAKGSKEYTLGVISFNSGDNTTISIIGERGAQQVIYDEFAIETIQPETF